MQQVAALDNAAYAARAERYGRAPPQNLANNQNVQAPPQHYAQHLALPQQRGALPYCFEQLDWSTPEVKDYGGDDDENFEL